MVWVAELVAVGVQDGDGDDEPVNVAVTLAVGVCEAVMDALGEYEAVTDGEGVHEGVVEAVTEPVGVMDVVTVPVNVADAVTEPVGVMDAVMVPVGVMDAVADGVTEGEGLMSSARARSRTPAMATVAPLNDTPSSSARLDVTSAPVAVESVVSRAMAALPGVRATAQSARSVAAAPCPVSWRRRLRKPTAAAL